MRKHLSLKESFDLAKLIQEEYAIKGLDDKKFAEYASSKLNCKVTFSMVQRHRSEFGIESSKARFKSLKEASSYIELNKKIDSINEELQKKIKILENRIEVYIKGSR